MRHTRVHENGQSIVMVTHDKKSALRGNRVIYIRDGKIDAAYGERMKEFHTACVNVGISQIQMMEDKEQQVQNALSARKGVEQVETHGCVYCAATVEEFHGMDFTMNLIFYNMVAVREINRLSIMEEAEDTYDHPVYLPYYVAEFGQFRIGDSITYRLDDRSYTYQVAGIVEEMQYGNYGAGLMAAYLPEAEYETFQEEDPSGELIEYSVLSDTDGDTLLAEVNEVLKEQDVTPVFERDADSVKKTRTMVCDLLILVFILFAGIILFVSMFLCRFRIQNAMVENMADMGVLKAIGYTGGMIRNSMVFPYLITGGCAVVPAIAVSYGVLPALSRMLAAQSGFLCELRFDPKALLLSAVLVLAVVWPFCHTAAGRVLRLQPIAAIRGTAGEAAFRKKGLLFFVAACMMVLVAFAGTLFYNVVMKPEHFVKTLSEERW